jgi:AmpE protein
MVIIILLQRESNVRLLVILIVFGIHRLTHWVHEDGCPGWVSAYFEKIRHALSREKTFQQSVYLILLIQLFPIPLLLAALSCFALFFPMSILMMLCLNVLVLWYCLGDSRFKRCRDTASIDHLFRLAYSDVFAVIFWFTVLGMPGASFYYLTRCMVWYVNQQASKSAQSLDAGQKIKNLLDWIPVRLLGLSFALVGHFFIAASDLLRHLKGELNANAKLIAAFGEKAMALNDQQSTAVKKERALFLIERALWLWLIVLGLATVLMWIG